MIVERLDGKPAISESIDIIIENWGNVRYTKSYTSDANGYVKFSIPPVGQGLSAYSIQVIVILFILSNTYK